jgi:hypothetical protein
MKHILLFFMTLAVLVVCGSCEKEGDKNGDEKDDPKSAACDITAFMVNSTAWNISGTTITYTYPEGTAATVLTPVITVSPGASVTPASGVAQNFFTEQGVTYTVTAEDGTTTKTYTAKALIQAPVVVDSGTTGNCNWTLTGTSPNYTLTISGTGAMENHTSNAYFPWNDYWNKIQTLIIQEGVTSIGSYAFAGYIRLTAVTIGNSVTSIGDYAFFGCSALPSVTIGNAVETIGNLAFSNCTALTFVIIGDSITSISDYAFYGCTSLTSVTIGDAVETIGNYTFSGCTGLTSVIIGDAVETIGNWAFSDCSGLTSVTNLRTTPQSISSYTFSNVNIGACTLRVPTSAVNAYKAADVWKRFKTITGI